MDAGQIRTVRNWTLIHKWTSLIATVFLLVLCVTGLPLVFHEEIDGYLDPVPALSDPGLPPPAIGGLVKEALAKYPGDVMISIGFSADRPYATFQSAPSVKSPFKLSHKLVFDLRTGLRVNAKPQGQSALTGFLLELHKSLFLGLPGSLFLGLMALTTIVAIVSGVVLYAPFMRKLEFGTVRVQRAARLKWLDLHNLLGITTVVWALVVAATGAINTLHDPVAAQVRTHIFSQTRQIGGGSPSHLASIDTVMATAHTALPGGSLVSVFFPGAGFTTPHHYAVFARGDQPLTSKLFYTALVDGETGALFKTLEMPWYAKILLLSQPLHFGDYGGLPLKIIWALLDIVTIVVLGSGLYLWISRRYQRALVNN